MKYKIITTNSDITPYVVQRKNEKFIFPFWRKITKFKNYHDATRFVKDATERHSKHPAGVIVLEYDESDLVVERLRNQKIEKNVDRAESQGVTSAHMNPTSSAMGLSPMVSKEGIRKLTGLGMPIADAVTKEYVNKTLGIK